MYKNTRGKITQLPNEVSKPIEFCAWSEAIWSQNEALRKAGPPLTIILHNSVINLNEF